MVRKLYLLFGIFFAVSIAACTATPTTSPAAPTASNPQPTDIPATADPNAPLPFDDVSDSSNNTTEGTFTISVGASNVVLPNVGGAWTSADFTTTNTSIGLVLRVDVVRGLANDQTALAYAQATYPTGGDPEQISGTDFFVQRDAASETTRVGRKIDSTTMLILSFSPFSDASVLETQFDTFVHMLHAAQVS